MRQKKAVLTEVCTTPTLGPDIDGLSRIQQCGKWRRTNDSHMKSHFLLFLLVLHTICKARSKSADCGQTQSFYSDLVFLHYSNSYCSGCVCVCVYV